MTFKELRNQINNPAYDEYADLTVTDGRGVPINFVDAIDIPDPDAPELSKEELAKNLEDVFYLRPQIKVFMIDGMTDEELNEEDWDEAIREAPELPIEESDKGITG